MLIYEVINFYIHKFYEMITNMWLISVIYFPVHILLTCLLYNNFKLDNLKSKIYTLSKPIFCASIISIAIPWTFGILIVRALQGFAPYSLPIIIDEIECMLTIFFTILFARKTLETKFSWIYAIALLIFFIPNIGGPLFATSVFVISILEPIGTIIIIPFLTIIQIMCIRALANPITINYIFLFRSLLISNFISMIMLKYIFIGLYHLGIGCCVGYLP